MFWIWQKVYFATLASRVRFVIFPKSARIFCHIIFRLECKDIDKIAKFLNISYPPSLLFVLCILFLTFINFRNSQKISSQQEKIIELAQELAIVKEKVKNIKND